MTTLEDLLREGELPDPQTLQDLIVIAIEGGESQMSVVKALRHRCGLPLPTAKAFLDQALADRP